jgi:hypothetical protein
MNNATLISLEEQHTATNDASMIARLSWKPHVDLNPLFDQNTSGVLAKHLADLEDLTHSLTVTTAEKVHSLQPSTPI